MNCVGADNYVYFLSLLLALSVLLIYGTLLGYSLLHQTLERVIPANLQASMQSWSTYFQVWALVITADSKIGIVSLLMLMTAPLAVAFLAYHTYLIWAGMTTNESAKWGDCKEDVEDGFVYKAKRSQIPQAPPLMDLNDRPWPVQSDQILVMDDEPPMEGYILVSTSNQVYYNSGGEAPIDCQWTRVQSMNEVDNIYDLGFVDNLRDSIGIPVRRKAFA